MRTAAPDIFPYLSNWISTNLPKRLKNSTCLSIRLKKQTVYLYCRFFFPAAVTDSRVHLELLFFTVFALPNASSTGLDYVHSTRTRIEGVSADAEIGEEKKMWKDDQFSPTSRTCCSTVRPSVPDLPPMNARYLMSIFVVSVLPAPLSPLTKMDWLPWSLISALKLLPTTRKNAGRSSEAMKLLQRFWLQQQNTHGPVTGVCDGEEMGAELPKGGALVLLHHVHVIQMRQPLERVHRNQDVPGVRLPCQHCQLSWKPGTTALLAVLDRKKIEAEVSGRQRYSRISRWGHTGRRGCAGPLARGGMPASSCRPLPMAAPPCPWGICYQG